MALNGFVSSMRYDFMACALRKYLLRGHRFSYVRLRDTRVFISYWGRNPLNTFFTLKQMDFCFTLCGDFHKPGSVKQRGQQM